jgi:hypothetical protein
MLVRKRNGAKIYKTKRGKDLRKCDAVTNEKEQSSNNYLLKEEFQPLNPCVFVVSTNHCDVLKIELK